MTEFKIDYLNEPKLLFAGRGESLNPCIGLIKFGPRFSGSRENKYLEFKIGIIGSQKSIISTKELFTSFTKKIYPIGDTKPWKIPFPGLTVKFGLRFEFMYLFSKNTFFLSSSA